MTLKLKDNSGYKNRFEIVKVHPGGQIIAKISKKLISFQDIAQNSLIQSKLY